MTNGNYRRPRRIPIRTVCECEIGPLRPAGRLYCDNASTTFPKPQCVLNAVADHFVNIGTSAGRGAYHESHLAAAILANCRGSLARLINAESPERIILGSSCSEMLNVVLHGMLNAATPGTEVVVTALEHNSVLRPLGALQHSNGVQIRVVPCDPITSVIDPEDVRRAITSRTRLIVCCHASNVTGALQPVAEVCRIAREAGVPSLVDAAQAVGHVGIDVRALACDFLAAPGHKGLMGPLGTGVLYIRPPAEKLLATIKEGGTGSQSELMVQPEAMPERFEIGSHNVPGFAGLAASAGWLLRRGIAGIREHDARLCKVFMSLAAGVNHLTVYGPWDVQKRVGVVSVNVDGLTPADLAAELEARGILTRPGLHCAPLVHRAIGTFPAGTCRISFGPFMREDHIRRVVAALAQLADGRLGSKGTPAATPPPSSPVRVIT
jgi:cysteine desulfurase family protein